MVKRPEEKCPECGNTEVYIETYLWYIYQFDVVCKDCMKEYVYDEDGKFEYSVNLRKEK